MTLTERRSPFICQPLRRFKGQQIHNPRTKTRTSFEVTPVQQNRERNEFAISLRRKVGPIVARRTRFYAPWALQTTGWYFVRGGGAMMTGTVRRVAVID